MSNVRRFLLICHDRSGSNLLRSKLGLHPEIYTIRPMPVLEIISQCKSIGTLFSERKLVFRRADHGSD